MKLKNIFIFTFINLAIWCLLSLKYYFTSGFYWDFAGLIFTLTFIPGHLLLFALGLFVILCLASIIGPRFCKNFAIFAGAFFTLFFLTDIIVYSQYRFHISLSMAELFFGPAGREIFVFPIGMYLLMALGVLVVLIVQGIAVAVSCNIKVPNRLVILGFIALVFCFIAFNSLYAWAKFVSVPSITAQISYLPWANPLSVNTRLKKMGLNPSSEPLVAAKGEMLNYPLNPLKCESVNPKLNVLFILVDSLRSDMFTREIMPKTYAKYKNSRNGFHFKNHVSGGNATQAGVFAFFYGLPSTYWNAFSSYNMEPVFMQEMRTRGYEFGIFSSGKLNSPEFHKNIFSGIDNLRIESKGDTKYERDIDMQRDFEAFLDNRDKKRPFFAFMFYDSPHGFEYPPSFKEKFKPAKELNYISLTSSTDPKPYLNKYKNSINFIDGKLGEVFDMLKDRKINAETVVIITGDHGQEINDTGNNFWGHNSNFAKYQTHTPLIMLWPDKRGKDIEYRTTHYDIVPTVMKEILGCVNPPSDYSIGYNLFDDTPRPYSLVISYTKKAVIVDDNVSVIDNYGALENYDDQYRPLKESVDSKAISAALKDLSTFYK
ncbi:sulfatase-like hydrolase/transferase [Elusimicrobium minutum]|nr:sulfatase-like hydrolase/transferase [Elusimicrobium minutum]